VCRTPLSFFLRLSLSSSLSVDFPLKKKKGAGAKHVNKNSPGAIVAFVVVVVSFLALVAWVGSRAKRQLESFEAAENAIAFKAFDGHGDGNTKSNAAAAAAAAGGGGGGGSNTAAEAAAAAAGSSSSGGPLRDHPTTKEENDADMESGDV
jgi:hypothetical protein